MLRKILCFIGFHSWIWKASDFKDEFGDPDWDAAWSCFNSNSKPPSFSKCKYCGERYGSN